MAIWSKRWLFWIGNGAEIRPLEKDRKSPAYYSHWFPIHIDTLSMGLPIVYFKGSRVEFSKLRHISVPEIKVSMIRKYNNHKLQTNPQHGEEELQDIYSIKTFKRQ